MSEAHVEKQRKKLDKALRQIEELKAKVRRGEALEKTQLAKIYTEPALRTALRDLSKAPEEEVPLAVEAAGPSAEPVAGPASAEALCAVAKAGDGAEVGRLLAAGIEPDACCDGWRPLSLAADLNRLEAARLLVAAGADVDQGDARFGYTPLHCAAFQGHTLFVDFLLAEGAAVGRTGSNGNTPLHRAAVSGHEAVGRLLVRAGADLDAKNKKGMTAFETASFMGHYVAAEAFRPAAATAAAAPAAEATAGQVSEVADSKKRRREANEAKEAKRATKKERKDEKEAKREKKARKRQRREEQAQDTADSED